MPYAMRLQPYIDYGIGLEISERPNGRHFVRSTARDLLVPGGVGGNLDNFTTRDASRCCQEQTISSII